MKTKRIAIFSFYGVHFHGVMSIYTTMRKLDFIFTILALPLDIILLFCAGIAAYAIRTSPLIAAARPVLFHESLPFGYHALLTLVFSLLFVGIFALSGLYSMRRRAFLQEAVTIVLSLSAGMSFIVLVMFFLREWFDSRFILLSAWVMGAVFVLVGRTVLRATRAFIIAHVAAARERVLLVGGGNHFLRMKAFIDSPHSGMVLSASHPVYYREDFLRTIVQEHIDHVILTASDIPGGHLVEMADICAENYLRFSFVPDSFAALAPHMQMEAFAGVPVIELRRTPLAGWNAVTKRVLDICGALVGLTVFSPLFVLCACLIHAESKGPIFVKLRRVSRGKEFELLKFRSMIDGAEKYKQHLAHLNERSDGPLFKLRNDPRITRAGKFLRATRLDELPQFINVLKGDMSLVGPRPHEPEEVERYARHHRKVFAIKAGMSGLAQVSGAHELPFEEEVKLDTYYIEHWSLKKDIAIILRTIGMLLFDRSGY